MFKFIKKIKTRNSERISIIFIILLTLNISGCTYFFDKAQQENLSRNLACHYQFQQRPGTAVSPPQYYLCGNKFYPCIPYTPWTATSNSSFLTDSYITHPSNPSMLKRAPV